MCRLSLEGSAAQLRMEAQGGRMHKQKIDDSNSRMRRLSADDSTAQFVEVEPAGQCVAV